MSVLDRSALESSPLADLHTIASELSIDGYRRLRKAALVDAILERQGGDTDAPAPDNDAPATESRPAGRSRRGRRSTAAEPEAAPELDAAGDAQVDVEVEVGAEVEDPESSAPAEKERDEDEEPAGGRRRRGRRGGRGRGSREEAAASPSSDGGASGADEEEDEGRDDEIVEGVVELLANGSGFVRVDPPDPSDDDVYISSAQVKRCELVSGDRVAGPKRAPRRSERFASLIRVETINGRPASELADSVRFDDLPAAYPSQRIRLGSDDPTLKAIEFLTPFGRGSRVTISGAPRAGKSEALRRLAEVLGSQEELTVSVVLAGVRPEEITEWSSVQPAPTAAVTFAASDDARNAAIEPVIDQARRLAARGADAVVLIDTLDGAGTHIVRKAMASARDIVGSGSVTVIATASAPLGGETTVIALDSVQASLGRYPAIDLVSSGTLRPELLVGEAGASAIADARAEAAGA